MLSKKVIHLFIPCTLFLCCAIQPAEERPERRPTRFIVYSFNAQRYIPIVKFVAAALHLAVPADHDIVLVEHEEGLTNAIMGPKNTPSASANWVCIAHYDKCRPVVELTRNDDFKLRNDVNFHSILFFDSDPIERATTGAITQKIVNSLSSTPLDINYTKVLHRVYNFYNEATSSWFRKIYPADKFVTKGTLATTSWKEPRTPYLKGVNIKCFSIDRNNALNPFIFSEKLGRIPGFSNYGPTDMLSKAAGRVGQVLQIIDDNFLINTDLSCILANASLVTGSDVIPTRTSTPVIINRPTYWDGQSLSQIVASAGWVSWLTWEKIGSQTLWQYGVDESQRSAIQQTIDQEAIFNAQTCVQIPYFSPWLRNYRSKVFAAYATPYDWFNRTARVHDAPHKKDIAQAIVPMPGAQGHRCTAEREYLNARRPVVTNTLRSLGITTTKFPKIALVASGGGIRAMLATLGVLCGLEQTGLLDTITYICGLSGATWAIGPWISSGLGVDAYCKQQNIVEKVNRFEKTSFLTIVKERYFTTQANEVKTVFGQPWTFVDVWGLYIARNLLLNPDMLLSTQQNQIRDGHKPLPIYTAVSTDARARDWYEFTPFEIGSLNKNVYIPSWSFGRYFISGTSQDFPPEQSLGYLLGIFGSAMGAQFKDVLAGAGIPGLTASEVSLTQGIVPNFYFGIRNILGNNTDNLELVDAGADFNLPYPPISGINPERKADIIIFVDASGEFGKDVGGEIRKTIAWQQENETEGKNVHLPDEMTHWSQAPQPGTLAQTRQARIRTFQGDPVNNIPAVIYIPIVLDMSEDKDFPFNDAQRHSIVNFQHTHEALLRTYTNENIMSQAPTSTFNYTPDKSNFLLDLMSLNVQISLQKILHPIQNYIANMR